VWPWEEDDHWTRIEPILQKSFGTIEDFQTALCTIGNTPGDKFNFFVKDYEREHPDAKEYPWRDKNYFLSTLLPFIQKLALDLPVLFENQKIPILTAYLQAEVVLTKAQIASILAATFFHVFDGYSPRKVNNSFFFLVVLHTHARQKKTNKITK
jgi:hypothetical protein